ncbi:MAG: Bug family tripartite tricarboxylate transporter substrate binding protein, partial [Acetobacteraceae bacterium]
SAAAAAQAQDQYPSKNVRFVVPFAAGGATDIMARIMGQRMGELLGQVFVIDNRPGAGGNLGSDLVAKAPPDGYTLLMATASSHGANPHLYKKFPYDPVKDFVALGVLGINPSALGVHQDVPAKDVQSLIALIRANPGKYSFGSGGVGSILHLCGEQFRVKAGGLDIEHVPYRGSAPMINDLAGGQITMAFDVLPTILPQIQAGRVRGIANGAATRAAALPDLPTVAEQGVPGYECYSWGVILAPANTPAPVVATLHKAIVTALGDEAVLKRLRDTGMDVFQPPRSLAETDAFFKAEVAKWGEVVKATGVQLD